MMPHNTITKDEVVVEDSIQDFDPVFPPGYTPPMPAVSVPKEGDIIDKPKGDGEASKQPGFSVIEKFESAIAVGNDFGWDMTSCEHTLESIIAENGGNTLFDFASSSARGRLGGILCIWNKLVYQKSKVLCCDNYVVVEELIDIPLGGYSFTWMDKVASKMSKLDRFLVFESFLDLFYGVAAANFNVARMKHLDRVAAIDVLADQGLASKDDSVMRNESLKILSPDGLTFAFFKHFWSIIEEDVVCFVEDFFVTAHIPKGCNPSFIALIPKVLDPKVVSDFRPMSLIECQYKKIGKLLANRLSLIIEECVSSEQSAFIKDMNIIDDPLILNEVMEWYQKRKRRLMIFKVDFWEFLDLVMAEIGFGFKWRRWIEGCLLNARASILVNGAPIDEYEICRGLRQGDPLSPFLFILAMEGLHAVIRKALQIGLFKGALIGEKGFLMSHLMYADDVIFMGDWSFQNVNNLIGILRCFFLTSGLKINVQKSKLLGVRVDHEESFELASILGCEVSMFPFTYLGVPIGSNMSLLANWKDVMDKFKHKLSTWNSHIVSVGGRLTLIKAVLENLPTYCMVPCEDLWIKVIKNTHRNSGRIGEASFPSSASSPWIVILKATKHLMEKGIDLLSLCKRKGLRSDENVKSCTVVERLRLLDWFSVFRRPPRGGDEILQYTALRACTSQVTLSSQKKDGWIWSHGGSDGFSVASARGSIDDVILDVDYVATRWNRLVPAKVNVFFWRLNLNRIPTRVNLDRRGIDIGSVLCPVCDRDVETSNHLFFSSEMVVDLWVLVARWWELDISVTSLVSEWVAWIDSVRVPSKVRNCLDVVVLTLMWSIWCFRNKLLFSFTKSVKAILWDFTQSQSFLWISARNHKFHVYWIDWVQISQRNQTMNLHFLLELLEEGINTPMSGDIAQLACLTIDM
ncbi:RNA-directed DNA polymerase, eukaryota, reverse transcriptase zinc-binding domain protein [Tanacetum coccineum]